MSVPGTDTGLGLDDADWVLDVLAKRVDSFVAAWEAGGELPRLAEFVPAEPQAVRRLTLVELIKVDLEYRWGRRRAPRRIEDYLTEFPELSTEEGIASELLYEEFYVRKHSGDAVEPQEYFERFPKQATELGRLLSLEAPQLSTRLFTGGKPENVEVGERLDDFDLLIRLGKGTFATVFLARQRSMQRLVALKVSADRGNEPQTLAQLDHPHIVRVYDLRVLSDRGLRLLYMQYDSGGTLQEAIGWVSRVPAAERGGWTLLEAVDQALNRRGESPPTDRPTRERLQTASWPEVVCWLGIRLASALDYAHRRGVLHRDLKPANILLTAEAVPKLVDFNTSFCSKLDGASPGAYFGGSLAYMSPEQLEAYSPRHARQPESLDGRSDLYSLGVVLWELLTGSRPFGDEQLMDGWAATLEQMIQRRRAGVDPAALDRLPHRCPLGMPETLLTCLAPDPEQRYSSAGELARQLRLCLEPRAQKLLRPPARSWNQTVRRFPVLAVLLAAVVPNTVAALFNFAYNREHIVERLLDSQDVFWNVQLAVNAVAFPLGIGLGGVLIWPVARGLRHLRAEHPLETSRLQSLRGRCLKLGHYAAVISIVEWLIAGAAYPVAMHAAGVGVLLEDYVHFMGSLALCGLIAATYPFFAVTYLCVRAIYPAFVRPESSHPGDVARLSWLHRMTWPYMVLAASLPMLGVTLMVTLVRSESQLLLAALSAGGLVGFGLIFWLARTIQNDLGALVEVVSPTETLGVRTETFDTQLK